MQMGRIRVAGDVGGREECGRICWNQFALVRKCCRVAHLKVTWMTIISTSMCHAPHRPPPPSPAHLTLICICALSRLFSILFSATLALNFHMNFCCCLCSFCCCHFDQVSERISWTTLCFSCLKTGCSNSWFCILEIGKRWSCCTRFCFWIINAIK